MNYNLIIKHKNFLPECTNRSDIGKWHMKKLGNKTYEVPWLETPIELNEFVSDFYKSNIEVSDYHDYLSERNLTSFVIIEPKVKELNIDDLCAVLTMIIRQDRFNEGLLVSKVTNGLIFKIVERLEEII